MMQDDDWMNREWAPGVEREAKEKRMQQEYTCVGIGWTRGWLTIQVVRDSEVGPKRRKNSCAAKSSSCGISYSDDGDGNGDDFGDFGDFGDGDERGHSFCASSVSRASIPYGFYVDGFGSFAVAVDSVVHWLVCDHHHDLALGE